jgi:D-sedoheptulose 7-phosphate isomerase
MSIKQHFIEAQSVLAAFLADDSNFENIEAAGKLLVDSFQKDGKVLSCGNGGSLCDAMHFAEELTGRYRDNRPAIGAIAIADASHMACVGNDYGYEYVFSRYVEGVGRKGDVLLGITGKDGGKMAGLCDVEIRAPKSNYADRAQEIHIKVIHSLIDYVERNL